jgi:hypothetical protein
VQIGRSFPFLYYSNPTVITEDSGHGAELDSASQAYYYWYPEIIYQ